MPDNFDGSNGSDKSIMEPLEVGKPHEKPVAKITLLLSCPQSECDLFDYVIRPVFEFDREQGLWQQQVNRYR